MFSNRKIKEIQQSIEIMDAHIKSLKEENSMLSKESKRLSFLLDNPLSFKVGDKPFKDIVITKINHAYNVTRYGGFFYTSIYDWCWEVIAFDTKNKREVYLKLDCGNNLINPNK